MEVESMLQCYPALPELHGPKMIFSNEAQSSQFSTLSIISTNMGATVT